MGVGFGFTIIVYVTPLPVHPFALGVMVTVAEPVMGVKVGMDVTPV